MVQIIACAAFVSNSASALTYTAVLSGNFNDILTWGGIAPGSLLTADSVVIPSGITITLNLNQIFSSSSTLVVNGTLSSGSNTTGLIMTGGTLAGNGTINTDSLVLGLASGFNFTGTINVQALTSLGTNQSTAANVTVADNLYINSGTFNIASGNVNLSSNANIMMNGGSVMVSGTGSMGLSNVYNVMYSGSSATGGIELTGSGLNNFTLNMSSGSLTLSSNLVLNGTLTLASGNLVLNNNNLSLTGNANFAGSGSGSISSTSSSSISIASANSINGALRFAAGNNSVNNFTLNMGSSNNTVSLGSAINVNGTLTLTNGNLVLNNNDLSFSGGGDFAASGTGSISSSAGSNISITSTNGLSGALRFSAGGNTVNNLTVNMGNSSSSLSLGSGLNVNGMLSLASGNLTLNNNDLSFTGNGDFTASGSGGINASTGSNISILSSGSFSGGLRFNAGNNTVNNFTVDMTGSSNSVSLGSNLNINGTLMLSNGALVIPSATTLTLAQNVNFNSNSSLTVNGSLTGNGNAALIMASGSLAGSGTITVDSAVLGLMSGFNFTGSLNAQNLTSLGTTQSAAANVAVGSNLYVNSGTFSITSGNISLANNANIMMDGGTISVSGTGTMGLSSTYNVTYSGSSANSGIELTGAGLNDLTLNLSSGTVTLYSDLALNGTMTLNSGDLVLNNNDMSFGSNSDFSASGTGSINSTSGSDISIMSSNAFSGALRFSSGNNTIGDLTLDMGNNSNSVGLGSSLNIDGTLALVSGDLLLNNNDLSFTSNGDFSATGTGNINSTSGSNISVMSANSLSGALRFSASGNSVNNFTVNMGANTNNVSVGSDVNVNGTVTLSLGTLVVPAGVTLTLAQDLLFNNSSSLTVNGSLTSGTSGTGLIMTGGNLSGNGTITIDSAVLGLTTGFNFTGTLTAHALTSVGTTQSVPATLNVGSNLYINAGTFSISSGSLSLANNSNIMMSGGSISLSGSGSIGLTNTYNVTYSGSSTPTGVELSGSGLHNLNVNLSSGSINMSGNAMINGTLMLNSGLLNLGTHNLTISSGGSVSGGSSSSYVVTGNGGSLIVNLAAGASATFPVGTISNYAPAMVSAASGSASSNIGVMAMDSVYAQGASGTNLSATQSVVNATWFVSSDVSTGLNLSLQLMWAANMELNSFNRNSSYISHYTNGSWDANAYASATTTGGMYAMTRTNITSLSPFTVADNNASLNLGVAPVAANNVQLSVYPNPATSTLYYNTSATPDHVCIFDISGHLLKTLPLDNSNNISVSELPAGCYNICFYGQNFRAVQKFVKE